MSETGTNEWAASNVNVCGGCANDCVYCYAAEMAARFGQRPRHRWCEEQINAKAVAKGYRKRDGRVMFPSSHDITAGNIEACLIVLKKLLTAGNDVLIVTKAQGEIVAQLCEALAQWRDQIEFRITIGCGHDAVRRFWEPDAPSVMERYAALLSLHKAGWRTSVSCEPLLEPQHADCLVKAVAPYVTETIWIGAMKEPVKRIAWKYPRDHPTVARLLAWQTPAAMQEVYNQLKDHPKVRWKDSYRSVLGIADEKGGSQ